MFYTLKDFSDDEIDKAFDETILLNKKLILFKDTIAKLMLSKQKYKKLTVSGSEKDTKMSIKRQREPAASLQVREKKHMDDKPEYSLEFPKRDKKGKKKMKSKWE